ncbi:MAG: glycosyltransferase family 4 protein [Methanolobus sp.]|nr:glycosyltransferase family 4 protein [Methanolobus sp.]
MKKILFINQYGAPGKYHNFKRTAELASNFAKSGYEVVVLCSKTLHNSRNNIKFKNEMYDNVKYVYFKTIGYNNNFTRLIGMIQFSIKVYFYSLFKIKPDVVISSIQSIFAGLSGYYISRHFKVKHILEIRDLWPETLIQFGKTKRNSILSIILRTIEKKIYRKSDYIVPLMKNVELYFHDVLKIKKYGNVHHINNGVDFEKFKSLESKYSRGLFFNDSNIKNCVYTGSIGYANDIDLIIETAKLALANKANINFHFYGEGNLKNKYINYISEKEISNVYFHDSIPYDQLPSLLHHSDVLLLTTRNIKLYSYGISMNKIFDYLSSDTPVISTTLDTGDDIIGRSGWYSVQPENSEILFDNIVKAINLQPKELIKKTRLANNFIKENYTYSILSQKYLNIITHIGVEE